MNDNQRAKLMRAEKLVVFLSDNSAELATVADVAPFKNELATKIDETNGNDIKATEDTTGIAETKDDEGKELLESSLKLAAFLQIHALKIKDKIFANKIDIKRSELTGNSDNGLKNAARYLAETAAEDEIAAALAAITPVAYTAEDLDAHVTNMNQYDNLIARPNEKRSEKTTYTKAVARNMAEIDEIVADLRINMGPVAFLNLTLFDAFEAVALIDDAPSHSNSSFVGFIDASGQKKITAIVYEATKELMIKNMGASLFQIGFRSEAGALLGTPIDVNVGATLTLQYSAIAPEGEAIWLQNLNNATQGNYDLKLL